MLMSNCWRSWICCWSAAFFG